MRRCLTSRRSDAARTGEQGFTIVEVVISAVVVVMVGIATFGAISTAGRTTAETRHRAQAYGVAQADQARMRTFKVSTLSNYTQTRSVTVDGTPYSVASQGEFVTDATGTQTCTGSASPDYISITSTVTWPSMGGRPPVVIKSIVSPPNGSIAADRGALAIKTVTSRNVPLAGVRITGSGPASFTDITDVNGCVLFGNLPAGTYTITPTSSTALVDKNGDAPKPMTTSVVAQSTNTITLQYDRPGTINLSFTTRYPGGPPCPTTSACVAASSADTAMAFNSGMTSAKRFGTLGTRVATLPVGPLFPFTSPDTVYAGLCTANNPTPPPPATPTVPQAAKTVTVPVNGSVSTSIQLPALYLTVRTGSSSSSPGSLVSGGRVVIADRGCSNTKRVLATNSSGTLADPGLPYGSYDICADNSTVTPTPSQIRRQTVTNVAVKSLNGTSLTLYLNGTSPASTTGACP